MPEQSKPLVAIVMGSKTDEPLMQPAVEILKQFGIDCEVSIISAHRTPEKAREFGLKARDQGVQVIIAGAGAAAHLPGVIASWTTLPVIGVPLATSQLKGQDALYSIVQMPSGVPVACVGIDGAKNAALLAAEILSLRYEPIRTACDEYRRKLAAAA